MSIAATLTCPHGKTGGNYRQNSRSLFRIGGKLQVKLEFCHVGVSVSKMCHQFPELFVHPTTFYTPLLEPAQKNSSVVFY